MLDIFKAAVFARFVAIFLGVGLPTSFVLFLMGVNMPLLGGAIAGLLGCLSMIGAEKNDKRRRTPRRK